MPQVIADLLQEPDLLASIRAELKSIRDIERAAGRLSQASGNARDLVALRIGLEQISTVQSTLTKLIAPASYSGPSSLSDAVPSGMFTKYDLARGQGRRSV